MKHQNSDELDNLDVLIDLAVNDCLNKEDDEFDRLVTSSVSFSKSYMRRRKHIIRKFKYAPMMTTVKKIGSRAAMFAGVLLTVVLITAMSVSALREAIVEAVIEWYNDYVSIRFETEAPTENHSEEPSETEKPWDAAMTVRKPRNIPEGVEEIVLLDSKVMVLIDYYVDNVLWASYNQTIMEEQNVYVDNEAVIIDQIDVHGYEAVIFQYAAKEQTVIMWNDGVYIYRIYTYGTIDELISLAKSIE